MSRFSIDWFELSLQVMIAFGHFLWQACVIGFVLFVAQHLGESLRDSQILRRRRSIKSSVSLGEADLRGAHLRYSVACLAFFSLPICVIATIAIVHQSRGSIFLTANDPIGALVIPAAGENRSNPPLSGSSVQVLCSPDVPAEPLLTSSAQVPFIGPTDKPELTSPGTTWMETAQSIAPYLLMAYSIGVALMLTRFGISIVGSSRLRRTLLPLADSNLLKVIAERSSQLGLKRVPIVALCQRVSMPVVVGIVKPMILLPPALLCGLDPNQLAAVLSHEMAHIRRYDLIVNLLQRVFEALLFFHPVTWWISRNVSVERENCCDDVAAGCTGRLSYASALLQMADLCVRNDRRRMAALASLAADGGNTTDFGYRIRRLIGAEETTRVGVTRRSIAIGLAMISLLTISLVAWGQSQQLANDEKPKGDAMAEVFTPEPLWQTKLAADDVAPETLRLSPVVVAGKRVLSVEKDFDLSTGKEVESTFVRLPRKNVLDMTLDPVFRRATCDREFLVEVSVRGLGNVSGLDWGLSSCDIRVLRATDGGQIGTTIHVSQLFDGITSDVDVENGADFLVLGVGNEVHVYRTETGLVETTMPVKTKRIDAVAISPDREWLVVSDQNDLHFWRWRDQAPVKTIHAGRKIDSLVFTPDGQYLAEGPDTREDIQIRDMRTLEVIASLKDEVDSPQMVTSMDITPDGRYLVAHNEVSVDQSKLTIPHRIHVWDLKTREKPVFQIATGEWVRSVAFSDDGRMIVGEFSGAAHGALLAAWQLPDEIIQRRVDSQSDAKDRLGDGFQWSRWGDKDGLLSGARLILPDGGLKPGQPLVVEYRLANVSKEKKTLTCYLNKGMQFASLGYGNRISGFGLDRQREPVTLTIESGDVFVDTEHVVSIDTTGLEPGEYQAALGSAFFYPDSVEPNTTHEIPHRGSIPFTIVGESTLKINELPKSDIHWGSPIAGLQVGARFPVDPNAIAIGESVEADLFVANVSSQPIECSVALPHPRDGWLFNVEDSNGNTIMLQRPIPFSSPFPQEYVQLKLAPGEVTLLTNDQDKREGTQSRPRPKFEIEDTEIEVHGWSDNTIKGRLVTQGGQYSAIFDIVIVRLEIPSLRLELDSGNIPFKVLKPTENGPAVEPADNVLEGNRQAAENLAKVINTGALKGRITLDVFAPKLPKLRMPTPISPTLSKRATEQERKKYDVSLVEIDDESLQIDADRGLANAFVYLAKAPSNSQPLQLNSKPFALTMHDYRFEPRAAIIRTGQDVRLNNSAVGADNFAFEPIKNDAQNRLVSAGSEITLEHPFTSPERIPIQAKSQTNPWKTTFLLPLDHPFAAITDKQGKFSIEGLPPGEHQFLVWHERSGWLEKSLVVNIEAGKTTEVHKTYGVDRFRVAANHIDQDSTVGPSGTVESIDPATKLGRATHQRMAVIDTLPKFYWASNNATLGTFHLENPSDDSLENLVRSLDADDGGAKWFTYSAQFGWDEDHFIQATGGGPAEEVAQFRWGTRGMAAERNGRGDNVSHVVRRDAATMWKDNYLTFPNYILATRHVFWWGDNGDHRKILAGTGVPPSLADYEQLPDREFDSEVCHVIQSKARREMLIISKASGLLRGYVLIDPHKHAEDVYKSETVKRITGVEFKTAHEYTNWSRENELTMTSRQRWELSKAWSLAADWSSSESSLLVRFRDYREIVPGVIWPFREDRVQGSMRNGKFECMRSCDHVQTVVVNKDLADKVNEMRPREGEQVQDQRFQAIVDYKFSKDREESEIMKLVDETFQRQMKNQLVVDQAKKPYESMIGTSAPELPEQTWVGGQRPELDGKPYLIHFWATWCGPCKNDLPLLKRFSDAGGIVIGMHPDGTPVDEVSAAIKSAELSYPTYVSPEQSSSDKPTIAGYPAMMYPYCLLVDSKGIVVAHGSLRDEKFDLIPRYWELVKSDETNPPTPPRDIQKNQNEESSLEGSQPVDGALGTTGGANEKIEPWEISKLYEADFLRNYLQDHETLPKPIVVPAVSGKVFDPDGKPASGVSIVSHTPRHWVDLDATLALKPHNSGGVRKSKQNGTFGLPERTEPYRVLFVHESGVANVSHEELLRANGVVTLQKWASVTGRLKLDGKPQADETIMLDVDTLSWSYSSLGPRLTTTHRTTTDKDGNFSFDRVPPLGGMARSLSGHGAVYQCESGKNTRIEIGAGNAETLTVSDNHDHHHDEVKQEDRPDGKPQLPRLIVKTVDSDGNPVPDTGVLFYDRNSHRTGQKQKFEMVSKRADESGVADFGVIPNRFGCLQLSPSKNGLAECYTLISTTMTKCTQGNPPRANVQTEIKDGILTVTFTMTPHVDLEFNIVDDATNEIVFWSEIFYQDPITNRWWQFGLVDGSKRQHNFIPISPQITKETIRISALGYETKVFRLPDELDRSQPIRRDVRLKPMPDVELKVLLPDGTPAETAKLTFHYPNELDCLQTQEELSDAQGIMTTKFPPNADIGIFRFEHTGGTAQLSMKELLEAVKQNPEEVIRRTIQLRN